MRDWPFKVLPEGGARLGELMIVGSRETGKSMLTEELARATGAAEVFVSPETPVLPKYFNGVKIAQAEKEESNTCQECGTPTTLLDMGPWDAYSIERCPACGQLHHFYKEL